MGGFFFKLWKPPLYNQESFKSKNEVSVTFYVLVKRNAIVVTLHRTSDFCLFWTELCTAESVQTGLPIDGPPGATDSLSEEKVPGNKTLTTNPVLQVIDKNQIRPYILRRRFIKKKCSEER